MTANEDENRISSESNIVFKPPLYIQRYQKAIDILGQNNNVTKVADFGCAEGKFVRRLKRLSNIEEIACIDCDDISLEQCLYATQPLAYDYIFGRSKQLKLDVYKGSVAEKDSRLKNFDAITCIELIEHLSADVLSELPQNIFGFIRPKLVIITTPNIEFNVLFNFENSSKLRHWDHKFEWTRNQFDNWCQSIVKSYPQYVYEITGVGEPSEEYKSVGFCSQIAIFKQNDQNFNELDFKDCNESQSNYQLIRSFLIEKNNRNQSQETEELIDWSSVLN